MQPVHGVRIDLGISQVTQRQMAEVFNSTPENVLMRLHNIFASGELEADATTKKCLAVRTQGRRRVRRKLKHYRVDAIISGAAGNAPRLDLGTARSRRSTHAGDERQGGLRT